MRFLLLLVGACTPATPKLATPDPDVITIGPWTPCAFSPQAGDTLAECAVAVAPIDYADPTGTTLSLALKRLPASKPRTGMLWLLDGGPGASALDDMQLLAQGFPTDRPDSDLYVVDHRGIGGSGRLSCPVQEAPDSSGGAALADDELPSCIRRLEADWGADLASLNTTNSARDLAVLIDALAQPDDEVFVWGGSYGTYLAQRYLQLRPDQPTAVVIDSIAPPDLDMAHYDQGYDQVGRQLLDLCGDDPSCSAHLGSDPVAMAQQLVASFDAGHCREMGVDAAFIQGLLAGLLGSAPLRDLVPAVLHRLDRCALSDMNAVANLYNTVWGASLPAGNTGKGRSEALFIHIAASELCGEACLDSVALQDQQQDLIFATGLTAAVASIRAQWPTYQPDAYDDQFSSFTGPMLMLQGGLDPATPLASAERVRNHYGGDHQVWAHFPYGAHLNSSGVQLADGTNCAYELALAFLANPTDAQDLGCIDEVLPIAFDGTPSMNQALFGTEDAWGDP